MKSSIERKQLIKTSNQKLGIKWVNPNIEIEVMWKNKAKYLLQKPTAWRFQDGG
jgi:basic membrane lipoprotein Med (substrate-binding protein (PBP1-ABC) superfamily)